ncbi:MAG: c-type cytochrome [Spirosomaceae bacterium]|jgi:cytochrome c oxidase cbb3-type subunit 3|nr:c-type cytochrome [Spirosomataceae bacterium]
MENLVKSGEELIQLLILLVLIIITVVLLVVVLNVLNVTKRIIAEKEGKVIKSFSFSEWWDEMMGTSVPLEKEEAILLDHNYDGIRELDNHLPPWWKGLFYVTIVFAIAYIGIYHIWNTSPLQDEEYQISMDEAKKQVEAYQAKLSNSIDESSVKLLVSDAKVVASGKEIYVGKCAVCHGQLGEGGVGPNLTDEYWLHGGTVNDIFKTVKYGVPEKGMISWKATLKPNEIQDVSNFILTMQGSNPPNAKAPQGEKGTAKGDSTAAKPLASL